TRCLSDWSSDVCSSDLYANKISAIDDPGERADYVAGLRAEYEADIDLLRLASELVIDAVVQPEDLRDELVRRLALAATKDRSFRSEERRGGKERKVEGW